MDMMDRLPTRADNERQAKRDAASIDNGRTTMRPIEIKRAAWERSSIPWPTDRRYAQGGRRWK